MRKEVVYAIIAGIVLGLVVAYGVYRINSELANNTSAINPSPTPSATPAQTNEFKVVIDKPNQNEVLTSDLLNLTGLTKQNSWVVISTEDKDYLTKSDTSGGFSKQISLISGVNQLKVTAFDPEGKQSSGNVHVVYSSSFEEKSASESSEVSASAEATLKQRVAQGIQNLLNSPKAYIGTVTDVTDATIETKSDKGDIQQISVNTQDTTVVNATGKVAKTVKTNDIAIGDFIVAMGYAGENSVLAAQRILVVSPLTEPKTTVEMAKVDKIGKKDLSIKTLPNSDSKVLQPDSKTGISMLKDGEDVKLKFASIAQDDNIIFVDTPRDKETTITRSVFVLPKE